MDSHSCRQMSRQALIGMAHDAQAAAAAVENLASLGRVVKRRTYPILDLLRMGTSALRLERQVVDGFWCEVGSQKS